MRMSRILAPCCILMVAGLVLVPASSALSVRLWDDNGFTSYRLVSPLKRPMDEGAFFECVTAKDPLGHFASIESEPGHDIRIRCIEASSPFCDAPPALDPDGTSCWDLSSVIDGTCSLHFETFDGTVRVRERNDGRYDVDVDGFYDRYIGDC